MLVGVLVDDDPGRDLGERGHRFFFSPEEVVPLRVLVAGIGNVFLGDDGFGVELAKRVSYDGVDVVDFGIRGMDLAYALADYDVVVFLDATPRGERAGNAVRDRARPRRAAARRRRARDGPGQGARAGEDARRASCRGRSCSAASRPAVEEFTDLSEPVRGGAARGRASCSRRLLDDAEKEPT